MSFTALIVWHNDADNPITKILKPGDRFSESDLYEAGIEIATFEGEAEAQAWIDEHVATDDDEPVEEWSLSATQAFFKGIHSTPEGSVPNIPGSVFNPNTEKWEIN
jgi:hypothetical protein